jgi:hypothetical protein
MWVLERTDLIHSENPPRLKATSGLLSCSNKHAMRSLLSIFLCFLAVSSPSGQTIPKRPQIKQGNPPDRNPQYFPVGLFSVYPELSDWEARWYASELRALHEPSLLGGKAKHSVVYRFLLIPSFTPSLAIRLVVHPDGTGTLVAKLRARSKGETEPAPAEETVSVSSEQVGKFEDLLDQSNFWFLPTKWDPVRGADGEEWILEAKKNRKYHVVDRWSGWREVSYSQACEYLRELSPLKSEILRRKRPASNISTPTPD